MLPTLLPRWEAPDDGLGLTHGHARRSSRGAAGGGHGTSPTSSTCLPSDAMSPRLLERFARVVAGRHPGSARGNHVLAQQINRLHPVHLAGRIPEPAGDRRRVRR
jgi:hypothetical protein